MRRRPDIRVSLRPPYLFPGEVVTTTLTLESPSDTPCDHITFDLVGKERRYERTVSTGNSSYSKYYEVDIVRQRATVAGFRLTPGTHVRAAKFEIPERAPPTYTSSLSSISYELTVRVAIPWWPDRVAKYRLVCAIPPEVGVPPNVTRFTSHPAPLGTALFIEASLGRDDFALGSTVEGVVSLANVAHHRIRRVQLSLVAIETARVRSAAGPTDAARATWTIHEGKPAESAELRFRITIPENMPPTFQTPYIAVTHELRVIADISLGSNIHIAIPVRVHRPRGDVTEQQAEPARVGKGKKRSNWERALGSVAGARVVAFDDAKDEVTLDAAGCSIHVRAEHHGTDGPFLVAEIAWPSLGLGLRLAERSWTDLGKKAPGALAKRFSMEARENLQAEELFDEATTRAILSFKSVGLEDAHAAVASPGSSHATAAIESVVKRAIQLSQHIVAGGKRVSPPAALKSSVGAYEAFAARRSAVLTRGDLSVSGILLEGAPAAIRHRFEGATPQGSTLSLEIAAAPGALDGLVTAAATIFACPAAPSENGIAIELTLLEDPASIDVQLDSLGEAVRTLQLRAQGPYR